MLMSAQEIGRPLINRYSRSADIRDFFDWRRLEAENIGVDSLMEEICVILNGDVDSNQVAEIFYELGKLIGLESPYKDKNRIDLKDKTYTFIQNWLDNSFDPREKLSHFSLGHFYAAFSFIDNKLPSRMHEFLCRKVVTSANSIKQIDGARIIDYYASTADVMHPKIFDIAVEPILNSLISLPSKLLPSFMANIAILDAIYGGKTSHFITHSPASVYKEMLPKVVDTGCPPSQHKLKKAENWFGGKEIYLPKENTKPNHDILRLSNFLPRYGLEIDSDFNRAANQQGIVPDIVIKDKNIGIMCDTWSRYSRQMGGGDPLKPNGKNLFNSAALVRSHPDQVILRMISTLIKDLPDEKIVSLIRTAQHRKPGVYGVGFQGEIDPIQNFSLDVY